MKKILIALTLVIASIGAAADTWSPQATIGLVNVGTRSIEVSGGLTFACNLSGSVTIDAAGNASVGSLSLIEGFACPAIFFNSLPYTMVGNTDNTVTLQEVNMSGVTGHCFGDLTGDFNQATGELSFNNAVLPNVGTGLDCKISGTISTNPQVSFVP
ncbi:hypothetical protein [Microbulbifer epialgicus]|uniref:Protein activator of alkane oxidation PraB n=1 Tax=Microbulbifer epialgicus TaxID=393907 RepID=A0ABV4NUP9_9GAMM